MLSFPPLKAPVKIAGDSVTGTATTSYTNMARPVLADGSKAPYLLVSWEDGIVLQARSLATGGGSLYPQQPVILNYRGDVGNIYFRTLAGTVKVHITPIEEF